MKRTLLISSSEQSAASLRELLVSEGFEPVTVSYTAFNARETAAREPFDLICINAPLADENGRGDHRAAEACGRGQRHADAVRRAGDRQADQPPPVPPLFAVHRLLPHAHPAHGERKRAAQNDGGGSEGGRPRQAAAGDLPEHDRGSGAPLSRKAGDGSAGQQGRRRQAGDSDVSELVLKF